MVLSPAITPLAALVAPYSEDFLSAVGLDTGNIEPGYPRARVLSSLIGFEGQVLLGVGTVTSTGPTTYEVDANYSLPIVAGLTNFTPVTWLVTEAADIAGRISRSSQLIAKNLPIGKVRRRHQRLPGSNIVHFRAIQGQTNGVF